MKVFNTKQETDQTIANFHGRQVRQSMLCKVVCMFLLSMLYSCASYEKSELNTHLVTDGTGRTIEVLESPQTVMALSPSMTELLFALELNEKIVGRTDQCDYPNACLKLPKVQIYPTVDLEGILKLRPDVVVSNAGITPLETAEKLTELGVPVLLYDINSIGQLYESIGSISDILAVKQKGDSLIAMLQNKTNKQQHSEAEKTCLALVSIDPIYVHGSTSFLNEILDISGFKNVVDSSMGNYPQLSREYVLKKNPDYLIGYDFEGLDSTFFQLYPELRELNAYQNRTVISLDHDLSSRPGPRFIQLFNQLEVH